MEYKSLGRTGLKVSVAGIGCGGHSRLGQQYNVNKEHSIALLLEAMDLGVNFIDTAQNYRTEEIVGEAVRHRIRSDIILSTKTYIRHGAGLLAADDLLDCIDRSLRNLSTDYVDIYHLHGVQPSDYRYARQELLPALLKAKDAGKIRCIGLTEATSIDPQHETLQMAILDGGFDATMFAFHIMHQNARHLLLPKTMQTGVGTVAMCAMRGFFSDQNAVETVLASLEAAGKLPCSVITCRDALTSIVHDAGASNMIDAAYRYARHERGIDVVLFGTGNRQHLNSNIESIMRPPLPEHDLAMVERLFGLLEGVGLTAEQAVRPPPKRTEHSIKVHR